MNGVSVIVLTWNGIDLIKECFQKVVDEVESWDMPREIIVVDNGSQDDTVQYIKKKWPHITLIANDRNLGFGRANNEAVKKAQYDLVLFLNNDLVLEKNFIEPLLPHFNHTSVFAVAPKSVRWDRTTIDDGLRYGTYHSGLFSVQLNTDQEKIDVPHYVTFFCGACFLCRRDVFLELDCFDELYTPYAWEDLDLAYRAWKRGYTVVYEPRSICYHKREATTRSLFSNFFFVTLMWRNKFIFMWKNLTYRPYIMNHLILLPWKLIKFMCNGRWRYVVGFFRAVPYIPVILKKRSCEIEKSKLNDQQVIERSFCCL